MPQFVLEQQPDTSTTTSAPVSDSAVAALSAAALEAERQAAQSERKQNSRSRVAQAGAVRLCQFCGVIHQRDWNAAKNIEQEALRLAYA